MKNSTSPKKVPHALHTSNVSQPAAALANSNQLDAASSHLQPTVDCSRACLETTPQLLLVPTLPILHYTSVQTTKHTRPGRRGPRSAAI
jgi:hypothetical protein